MELDQTLLLQMFRKMTEIRAFEEKAVELFMAGQLPGFLHSCLGQEASAVGVCLALEPNDYVLTTHRGHGHLIAKGGDVKRMMAELFAKETGYCHGKGGSMHIADFEIGLIGANGIVGAGMPLAVGAALSSQMRRSGQVTVVFFGDGASNQGTFHESMNMASIWNLPVVFVCENNNYAESTCATYHKRVDDVATRAKAYDVPGVVVDGNDVAAVHEAARVAIERARSGQGPSLLECKTYRWLGHYVGDPGVYRPPEEVAEWKAREPVGLFKNVLAARFGISVDELERIEQESRALVDAAVEFAKSSPLPPTETALEDVFFDLTPWGVPKCAS